MSENKNELTITRVFDAPRHLVFEAWTKPEHIKKWLAPKGFDIPSAEGELKPGGAWRSSMRTPGGELLKMGGVYQEFENQPDYPLWRRHAST